MNINVSQPNCEYLVKSGLGVILAAKMTKGLFLSANIMVKKFVICFVCLFPQQAHV